MQTPDRELLHGNAETLVLSLLAEGDSHGYQLWKDLADRSNHYFQFSFGGLYPLLRNLEQRGFIRGRWVRVGETRQQKR
jgi:PadR family transcriptional regulator, regulatory protein PadR